MIALIPSCSWVGLAPFLAPGMALCPKPTDRGPALCDSRLGQDATPETGWPLPNGSCARLANISQGLVIRGGAALPNMLANHGFKCPPPQEGPLGSVGCQIPIGSELLGLCVNMEVGSEKDV